MRRYWLLRNRFFATLAIVVSVSVGLHFFLSAILQEIYSFSPNGISFQTWLFPSTIHAFASILLFIIIYRDLFSHQGNVQFLKSLAISPNSKFKIILSIAISSVIECALYGLVSSLALLVILPQFMSFTHYLSLIGYLLMYLILLANIMITFAIIFQRLFIFLFVSTSFLFFISAATSFLFEDQMSSSVLSSITLNNPLTMIVFDLRALIFFGEFQVLWIILSILISLFWLVFNAFLLKRKLKQ